jgi:hypothetical protein
MNNSYQCDEPRRETPVVRLRRQLTDEFADPDLEPNTKNSEEPTKNAHGVPRLFNVNKLPLQRQTVLPLLKDPAYHSSTMNHKKSSLQPTEEGELTKGLDKKIPMSSLLMLYSHTHTSTVREST